MQSKETRERESFRRLISIRIRFEYTHIISGLNWIGSMVAYAHSVFKANRRNQVVVVDVLTVAHHHNTAQ